MLGRVFPLAGEHRSQRKRKENTMDFKLNEMEQEIVDMLHDFCLKEVKPIAAELDEKEEFTQNAREKLAEMGMLGTYIPEEYGGAGLSYLTYIACARSWLSTALPPPSCSPSTVLCAPGPSWSSAPRSRSRSTWCPWHRARSWALWA